MKNAIPTNPDDAFVEGWYFGRYGREANFHPTIPTRSTPLPIRREYERGVAEGHQFQADFDNKAAI